MPPQYGGCNLPVYLFGVSLPTFFAKKVGYPRSPAVSSLARRLAAGGCPGALAADRVPKVAALPNGPPQYRVA
ncbi:hypothetical protein SUBVAR_07142, partial [Subdoligranulum variabile DSM 15176]